MGSSSSTNKKKTTVIDVPNKNSSNQNTRQAAINSNQQPVHKTANQKPVSTNNSTSSLQSDTTSTVSSQTNNTRTVDNNSKANQEPVSLTVNQKPVSPTPSDTSSSKADRNTGKSQPVTQLTAMSSGARWQDADLANLISGLNIKDESENWEDVVDQLITRYDPKIIPEKKVSFAKNSSLCIQSYLRMTCPYCHF